MATMQAKELPANLFFRRGALYFRCRAGKRINVKVCPYQGLGAFTSHGAVRPVVHAALGKWIGELREAADRRRLDPEAIPDGAVPTWEKLIDEYLQIARRRFAEDGRPSPATAKSNAQRLQKLLQDLEVGLTQDMTSVTPDDISEWAMEVVEEAKDVDAGRYLACRTLGQVTSIWAKWTRLPYERKGIIIPPLIDRWPDIAGVAPLYRDPPDDLKTRTINGGKKLEQKRPGVWLLFALMLHTGMRPGDAKRSQWDWFREMPNGSAKLVWTPSKTRRSSRGRQVEQVLTKEIWQRMRGAWARAGDGGAYVVPGGEAGRQAALDGVNRRMRLWGWKTPKASYELRKLFVSAVYNAHGLMWAAAYSGDNPTTIEKYYSAAYRRDAPSLDVAQIVTGMA